MKWLRRLLKFAVSLAFTAALIIALGVLAVYVWIVPELPDAGTLRDVKLQVPLRVYTSDHKLIAEFGEKRRLPVIYNDIPHQVIEAFLAAEDDRFREHPGVDYQGLIRAALDIALTGKKRQGGSTITMQVARNFYLTPEKTYIRKLKEIVLALRIEQDLSKNEILELYLNKIYLGQRAYGIGAAAEVYYGKSLDELDLAQTAMIAGLPKAPSKYNPVTNPQRALIRRNYVLDRMHGLNMISDEDYETARNEPVTATIHRRQVEIEAPYVAEMVRNQLVQEYGNDAYTSGFQVTTTLRSDLQVAANDAVRLALAQYEERHGYRGPEATVVLPENAQQPALDSALRSYSPVGGLLPAVVTMIEDESATIYFGKGEYGQLPLKQAKWAAKYISVNRKGSRPKKLQDVLAVGDVIRVRKITLKEKDKDSKEEATSEAWRLAQIPKAESALISVDPNNGSILALSGGFDYYHSKFNRVIQALRQPGSGFKAFIYSAALEAGYTPASLINDAPIVLQDSSLEGDWRPENYSRKFFGPTRMRVALAKSRNLVSIRLLRDMGIDHAMQHIGRFGFDVSQLPRNLSLALGSGGVTMLQMARGYSVLANGGYLVEPYFISRIEDTSGNPVLTASPLAVCRADCPPEIYDTPESSLDPLAATEELSANQAGPEQSVSETSTSAALYAPRAVPADNIFLMNSMMSDVIRIGTAQKARALGRSDLAGKTGTTNDQRDAWFSGFNRNLVAIAWVGLDSSEPLGRRETGGTAALPAWMHYMKVALKDVAPDPLKAPENIVTVKIDPVTGLKARPGQHNAIFEIFRKDNTPQQGTSGSDNATGTSGNDSAPDIF